MSLLLSNEQIDTGITTGRLEILNISDGDTKFTFDENDPVELAKAKGIITDMMKRGYSIFIETDKGLKRVKRFSAKRNCYIIGERTDTGTVVESEVPITKTKATAVGRTAGG